ncbi:MAG: glycosyltransferase, partial [Planctomycetota bacterium]
MKSLVIIPTYNERANIIPLIRNILKQGRGIEVLVVDDNSPDGTADAVRSEWGGRTRVSLLRRSGKLGLGTAHIAGFRWALGRNYDRVITMDADFSHPPECIPALLERSGGCEVVLGSRYVEGGGWENW